MTDEMRPASEAEKEAYLNGYIIIEGSVETEEGLMIPVYSPTEDDPAWVQMGCVNHPHLRWTRKNPIHMQGMISNNAQLMFDGGWFPCGTIKVSAAFADESACEEFVVAFREEHKDEGEYPTHSVLYRGGNYSMVVEDHEGADYPQEIPHYE